MKKTLIRVIALALVAVTLVCCLASCGKTLSGSYEAELNRGVVKYTATYTFKGSDVTIVKKSQNILGGIDTTELKGTYEIVENEDKTMEITITLEKDDESIKSGTWTFEEGETYIKIGEFQYNKVESK